MSSVLARKKILSKKVVVTKKLTKNSAKKATPAFGIIKQEDYKFSRIEENEATIAFKKVDHPNKQELVSGLIRNREDM